MSQLRHDPLSDRDVIVAAARGARPTTFADEGNDAESTGECPFCPGQEARTPPEVARVGGGAPDGPGWEVRAFPNLYPIVEAHEVVVLTPDHRSFADLDDDEAANVVRVLRDRMHAHLGAGHVYGVAIINHLKGAGASIAHPHAQVLALDVVPRAVEEAVGRFRTAGIDLVAADVLEDHVVQSFDGVTTWCPPASSSPYLLRLAHASAGECFDRADDPTIRAVALALRDALRRVRGALGDVPYNVVVHTAPHDSHPFHWFVEVTPRVSVIAGFEQATGILVNTVPPDQAAEMLAGCQPDEVAVSVTIHICTTIAATPDTVWRAVERIETHTEWMLDAERITFRSVEHQGVGAEFDCSTRVGPLHTTDRFVVTRWEPGAVMGIEHRGAVTGVGEFRLRPLADGASTEFCWEETLVFPWWLGSVAGEQFGRPVLKRIWEGNLRRLKAKVESGSIG